MNSKLRKFYEVFKSFFSKFIFDVWDNYFFEFLVRKFDYDSFLWDRESNFRKYNLHPYGKIPINLMDFMIKNGQS